MAINPIVFSDKVIGSFLKYQLTTYPFADKELHGQLRTLLSLDETRETPLMKGPYISLSRAFKQGARVEELVEEKILHPLMRQRIPAAIERIYGHQERAIRAVHAGKTTLVSTGTGSGKSECFLYPIISRCLELKDQNTASGIVAVIVYPMNALAEDQLLRLRELLAGTGITFGMYVGKTPENEADASNLRSGASQADYHAMYKKARADGSSQTVSPPEEICSREMMRTPGRQPRILLTNVKQLELLLTRQKDVELFQGARLEYLVFDEAHTFTGAQGAETACLIRRLRRFCGKTAADSVCIATSATIVDADEPDAARQFASRFFGVEPAAVATVGEDYEDQLWADKRWMPKAPHSPPEVLAACAKAIDAGAESDAKVRAAFKDLSGRELSAGNWAEALQNDLSANELVFQLSKILREPLKLQEASKQAGEALGRAVSDEEVLAWLSLGAAARQDSRPLLRPVVHAFVRGIGGAVVTFPVTGQKPKLWLAAEDEIKSSKSEHAFARFPVAICTTCGQHYYTTHLKDFKFVGSKPEGGEARGTGVAWEPLDPARGGKRVILLDHVVEQDAEDAEDDARRAELHFCRHCGTAHSSKESHCLQCGAANSTVLLFSVRSKEDNEGNLPSCLSCKATGRRLATNNYREPARPIRATNVADVHVLAQDMVHHAERRRLLVFCDNRQEAAFQAGWMKDHSRRFRLRSLMMEELSGKRLSVGDLAFALDSRLEKDTAFSMALLPEVWRVARREEAGGRHQQERKKFLRLMVLREITSSPRQVLGLEPWGRLKIDYLGLEASHPFIVKLAGRLGLPADELCEGIASLLDYLRRQRVLFDREYKTFSRYWGDGELEIQNGYLPKMEGPKGTKVTLQGDDDPACVRRWVSERGDTVIRQMAKKWGAATEDAPAILAEVFDFLKSVKLLVPVTLTGWRGNALPKQSGLQQIDGDLIQLIENHGTFRCNACRRRTIRRMPNSRCPAWRCDGTLEFIKEDKDDYNLELLDQRYSMLRPEEHTAMVPHEDRERLENLFKGDSEALNCLVCTQTLELGVDIGALDAILMRNVPPLAANYWQRAGRAGRRHRMAVNVTYCRSMSHDLAYFADPLKMLRGRIDPPAFNLSNELMVGKHVHAAVITRLHQIARDTAIPVAEQETLKRVLDTIFPKTITSYLFDSGNLRETPFDISPLRDAISRHRVDIIASVEAIFHDGWPAADAAIVASSLLASHVDQMPEKLDEVLARLRTRLQWARRQIQRLNSLREKQGSLDEEDQRLFNRCDFLIKRLRGQTRKQRRNAEGYDDIYTFGALGAEGFLPGYGLEAGSVLGLAEIPFWHTGAKEFALPRPPSVALREYVPGNLIYANGNRFVARRFHREAKEEHTETPYFHVSLARKALAESNPADNAGGMGITTIGTIAVCDVDLVHQSQISDEEENRFQLSVAVLGLERQQHIGGAAYSWGEQSLQHRRGVRFRLVNVGASRMINEPNGMGYPVCTICGLSVSPLSSDRQQEEFKTGHTERCGRAPERIGFFADLAADALTLKGCADPVVAHSVLESLRIAATHVLDMHVDDLQVLVIGHIDRDEVDAHLWDPMPGGSGLIDQVIARFPEVVAAATRIVKDCPSACATSCTDCLQTYRNGFYHDKLDRKVAIDFLERWGNILAKRHDIPAMVPAGAPAGNHQPVNEAERRLRRMLEAAGFPEGEWQQTVQLNRAVGSTTPDVIYRAGHLGADAGIAIYLDGLASHLHGNPATAERDREIRAWLANTGWEVVSIIASDLDDSLAMTRHFKRLANYLMRSDIRQAVEKSTGWHSA